MTTRAHDDLILFDTEASVALFEGADVRSDFWTLCRYFVSERLLTYCGIASSVTVLNSLGVESPDEPQLYPYKLFTQANIFTDDVLKDRRPVEVEKHGNTLEQLAGILGTFAVDVDVHFAGDLDLDRARTALVDALRSPEQRVIIDFNRKIFHQKGAGHFSPLAAYHSGEDRFLVMDVARYKSPPFWVRAELLFEALTGQDFDSGKSRGFLIVTRHPGGESAAG